jgi:hypothetical protein
MSQINDLQLFLEEERLGHKNTKIQVSLIEIRPLECYLIAYYPYSGSRDPQRPIENANEQIRRLAQVTSK